MDNKAAARETRRATRRHGGRHEGSADSLLQGETATGAIGTMRDRSFVGIVGVATAGDTYLAGAADVGIVGQSEVGSGDYVGVDFSAPVPVVGACWVGRGLYRVT